MINTKLCTGCANSSRPQLDSYVGIVKSIGIIETFSEIGTAEEGHRDNSPRDTIPTDACPTGLETEVLDEADPIAHWVAWAQFIRSLSFIYLLWCISLRQSDKHLSEINTMKKCHSAFH